jgi:hypothetical protein
MSSKPSNTKSRPGSSTFSGSKEPKTANIQPNRGAMNIMALVTFAVATAPYMMAQPSTAVVQNYHAVLNQETRPVSNLKWSEHVALQAEKAERLSYGLPQTSVANLSELNSQNNSQKDNTRPRAANERHPVEAVERGSGRLGLVEPIDSSRKASTKVTKIQSEKNVPFRLIAIGSRESIMENIKTLHHLGYAEPIQWSNLQRGGKPGEFISILTVRGIRGV